jgi:hypothetical protein
MQKVNVYHSQLRYQAPLCLRTAVATFHPIMNYDVGAQKGPSDLLVCVAAVAALLSLHAMAKRKDLWLLLPLSIYTVCLVSG